MGGLHLCDKWSSPKLDGAAAGAAAGAAPAAGAVSAAGAGLLLGRPGGCGLRLGLLLLLVIYALFGPRFQTQNDTLKKQINKTLEAWCCDYIDFRIIFGSNLHV